jgi:hypothetical protein
VSEITNANVEMRFEDGSRCNAWIEFTMRDTYTDPLGEMTFTALPPRDRLSFYQERLQRGKLVSILINNAPQGIFLIQTVNERIGKNGYEFQATCHTPLVTPYQGCVDPDYSFSTTSDVPLSKVIFDILNPYGFDTVIDDTGSSAAAALGAIKGGTKKGKRKKPINIDALKVQEARAQDGERAYAMCSRLVTRLGLQMRMSVESDTLGAVMLEAPDYDQAPSYTLVLDSPQSPVNVEGSRFLGDPPVEIVSSNDDQYSVCTIRGARADTTGQTSTSEPYASITAQEINPARPQYSSFAANFKPLHIKDKNSRDLERATSTAKLAMGIRAIKAFSITGEVDGMLSHNSLVWTVGTMARVVIPDKQIDEAMFVYERVFTMSRGQGKRTRLKLIPAGSLVLGDVPGGG